MRKALWTTALLLAGGCAFPIGGGSVPDESTSTSGPTGIAAPSVAPSPLLVVAYQATGLQAGRQTTISQARISFNQVSDGAEIVQTDDCAGYRAPAGGAIAFPGEDVGELQIAGGLSDHRCHAAADGSYGCDLPENEGFFAPGARLALRSAGSDHTPAFALTGIVPPRAPEPQVDLGTLFDKTGDIDVRWTPSEEPIPMTCLQLESFDAAGRLTGFVQCDVADRDGEAHVPATVAAMLDRQAPTVRAALFSVDGMETDAGGWQRAAYFGQGRFVELHR